MTYYPPLWFEERLLECRRIAPVLDNVGALVWDCVVPAEWCPPGNKRDKMHWSKAHRMKENVRAVMRRGDWHVRDWVTELRLPLEGRPVVHLRRYSLRRTDPRSNWDKFPVDALTPHKRIQTKDGPKTFGCLGLIHDDSGDHIDLRAEWCKSKLGCVYVRVFSGVAS